MGARLSLSGILLSSLCLVVPARAADFEIQRLQQKVADQDMLLRRQQAEQGLEQGVRHGQAV